VSTRLINKNFAALYNAYHSGAKGVVLEGSSRSGKTWAGIDFELYLTSHAAQKLVINNVRETYNSFKTTLYDDFDRRLNQVGLYSPFINRDVTSFNLLGSKVNFIGADRVSKTHGMGSDFFFINEGLYGIEKAFFDQLEQRCNRMWWIDYNPSTSDHWVFDLEKRDDVVFVKTTFLDNPFVPPAQKKKILSYDPSNPVNIEQGTADDYMWKVYGLGLRASPEGLVFPNVKFIDKLPEEYDSEYFGIDFGYTNDPTAIVRARRKGNNLYSKLHVYTPIDNANLLGEVIQKIEAKGQYAADSSDGVMIASLRRMGLNVFAAPCPGGSIKMGIDILKRFNLYIVKDRDAEREANNYKWRTINGISLNEPIDKFNHFWDALRYIGLSFLV